MINIKKSQKNNGFTLVEMHVTKYADLDNELPRNRNRVWLHFDLLY